MLILGKVLLGVLHCLVTVRVKMVRVPKLIARTSRNLTKFEMFRYIRGAMVRENYLKMKFFPGQGKVREFCGWPGKFRKDLESQ